jgi:putative hydrolase of the HAD superfamily
MRQQSKIENPKSKIGTPALIFDFGNVVAFFDYLKACKRFGKKVGLTAEDFRRRILERGFEPLLSRFESGQMASEEFAREVLALADLNLPGHEFVAYWQDIFWLNEPVAHLIAHLKASGYTLVLGSNTNVLHATYFRRQFATTLDRFDQLVFSHEVGCKKPNREFYRACVAAAGVSPGSCVFIDDLDENVQGARRAGLTALLYVDAPRLIADLRRLGVEVPDGECGTAPALG